MIEGEDLHADNAALHRECQQHIAEIERLRAALKRIDNESDCDHAAKIAQDALADEQARDKTK